MRRRFFVDELENGSAVMRGEAAHHLSRVLRAERGQLYELSDGRSVWLARIDDVGRDAVEFALLECVPVPVTFLRISLLLAIVKFDRFEWALEKATELGVDEVIPLTTDRSEKGLIAASAKRAERWKKILVESAQQSRRLTVPMLHDAAKPQEVFGAANAHVRLMLSERAGATPMRELLEPASKSAHAGEILNLAIAIGPEGGWTDAEFASALRAGFSEAALGVNILRTETAVCAALAAAQYACGAFRRADGLEDSRT
jgi:16S rRNA (uracil1498-N3)-methyltransferase